MFILRKTPLTDKDCSWPVIQRSGFGLFLSFFSVIYEPTQPDNEEKSAELFQQYSQECLTKQVGIYPFTPSAQDFMTHVNERTFVGPENLTREPRKLGWTRYKLCLPGYLIKG